MLDEAAARVGADIVCSDLPALFSVFFLSLLRSPSARYRLLRHVRCSFLSSPLFSEFRPEDKSFASLLFPPLAATVGVGFQPVGSRR